MIIGILTYCRKLILIDFVISQPLQTDSLRNQQKPWDVLGSLRKKVPNNVLSNQKKLQFEIHKIKIRIFN